MMDKAIKNFHTQFSYDPVIENPSSFKRYEKFVLVGMGGSHLAADLLYVWNPALDLIIHNDYGLPLLPKGQLEERLVILSSYSGNTEEVISAFGEAQEKHLAVVVIAIGGALLELAKERGLAYIQMPDTDIQPRAALGFSIMALLKAFGEQQLLEELKNLRHELFPDMYEAKGKELAQLLQGSVPVIYTSTRNRAIGYTWKIKLNETGKIPAFYNVMPELNHNEMTGFDVKDATRELSKNMFFLFFKDAADHPKIQKRMEALQKLYEDRGLRVKTLALEGKTVFFKIFSSLLLADWAAFYTGTQYGLETEQVPMVEEFKKLIA